jgi:hypothetical protein
MTTMPMIEIDLFLKLTSNTFNVQECMYGTNSPGQVFKLDENSLMEYVEELENRTGGMIVLDETAGLKQVYRRPPDRSHWGVPAHESHKMFHDCLGMGFCHIFNEIKTL